MFAAEAPRQKQLSSPKSTGFRLFLQQNRHGLVWALFILLLTGFPGTDIPKVWWLELLSVDKLVHLSVFFVQTLLFIRGFAQQNFIALLSRHHRLFAATIAMAYGGILELLQDAVFIERSADLYDFITNNAGCLLAIALYDRTAPLMNRLLNKR